MKKELTRSEFLRRMALLSGGVGLGISGIPGQAYAALPAGLAASVPAGNALVIIQLSGGNDGLNTVIPAENDTYFAKRPDIAIKKVDALALKNGMYLHPSMTGIKSLYDQGNVAIVQSVGYANPNRSHFRATDIWNTGSDANVVWEEGWAARYLAEKYPAYPISMPAHPMAIQLGSVESLLFQSDMGRFGTVFEDPNLFYQLVSGTLSDDEIPPATLAGDELAFLKQVSSTSIQYSTVIRDGALKGANSVTYPATNLAKQLGIVAKLISGGLETPVYLCTIGGFDTHANQLNQHANLWKQISDAVTAFQKDLKTQNKADKVTLMTFSEFGRRVNQNGTTGTDHGTAAPMFVIGNTVRGGLIGENPNLVNLDSNGDLKPNFDYRQVYSTVLSDHLGLSTTSTAGIFKKSFDRLPIFLNSPLIAEAGVKVTLLDPAPNPASGQVRIQFAAFEAMRIELAFFDMQGQKLGSIFAGEVPSGTYTYPVDITQFPAGTYLVSLAASTGARITKRLIIVN
ncbi:DUF1501 domain-containing protein [Aquirufa antheringensis]|uniref:DUF1501 domain-containing protein n=1 Tax=Aquirufa antheringensis TaxID=2516559 RepID=UPI00208F86DF|nr:DUF1501 domain-containing protein [Aquirufa antheringensis]USQ03177.1 DUF1501 domain-containing protein [Aquirufa antheringensis]